MQLRLEWFSFRDEFGRLWRVWLVDHIEPPSTGFQASAELHGLELRGVTIRRPREIQILATISPRKRTVTTVHELLHVACGTPPELGGKRDSLYQFTEEITIERIESGLVTILSQLSFTLPSLPEGFRKFRKQCLGR